MTLGLSFCALLLQILGVLIVAHLDKHLRHCVELLGDALEFLGVSFREAGIYEG